MMQAGANSRSSACQEMWRFIRGQGGGDVPCIVSMPASLWDEDPDFYQRLTTDMRDVCVAVGRDPQRAAESTSVDKWGCTWHYPGRYFDGQVVGHPLSDWAQYGQFNAPSVQDYRNWEADARRIADQRNRGEPAAVSAEHGFLYLRMTYLRGFENFMIDLATGQAELFDLRDRIVRFWVEMVDRYAALGAEKIYFGDDLGHQTSLPMSPQMWRGFLKPAFKTIFDRCHEHDIAVYMHTDGYIVELLDDLVEIGVDILNPQDLVNGLDNLSRLAKGRVAIDLDIDRQSVTVFGKPDQIDRHVRACIETLGSPGGQLSLIYGAYPGTPKENVAAVARAMQAYRTLWRRSPL